MPRAIDGTRRKNRRKKILDRAKGFWGRRSTNFKTAKEAVARAMRSSYRDRKRKKRDFRTLWIARISAVCRAHDITYSRFMSGLKKAGVVIDRKVLSNLAINDPDAFTSLIDIARSSSGVQE
ncbi:MAG: 50S ribosomal protein L20 [Spirochaetales bacterium]|nr:50S ribosomal protein L20 [Spirochaetales bacterium]